jgi:hypothetical protein
MTIRMRMILIGAATVCAASATMVQGGSRQRSAKPEAAVERSAQAEQPAQTKVAPALEEPAPASDGGSNQLIWVLVAVVATLLVLAAAMIDVKRLGRRLSDLEGWIRKAVPSQARTEGDTNRLKLIEVKLDREGETVVDTLNEVRQLGHDLRTGGALLERVNGGLEGKLDSLGRRVNDLPQVVQHAQREQERTLGQRLQPVVEELRLLSRTTTEQEQAQREALSHLESLVVERLRALEEQLVRGLGQRAYERLVPGPKRFQEAMTELRRELEAQPETVQACCEPIRLLSQALERLGSTQFSAAWFEREENQRGLEQALLRKLTNEYAPLILSEQGLELRGRFQREVELFQAHFVDGLRREYGVEAIAPVALAPYDPARHEIVATAPAPGAELHNRVKEVQLPGLAVQARVVSRARIVCYAHSGTAAAAAPGPDPAMSPAPAALPPIPGVRRELGAIASPLQHEPDGDRPGVARGERAVEPPAAGADEHPWSALPPDEQYAPPPRRQDRQAHPSGDPERRKLSRD